MLTGLRGVWRLELAADAAGARKRDERDPQRLELLEQRHQVLQVAAESIEAPAHDDVDAAPSRIREQLIEGWAPVLRAADAAIDVLHRRPSAARVSHRWPPIFALLAVCHTDLMRVMGAAGVVLVFLVTGVGLSSAAERHWQTGTWTDIGKRRDLSIGGAAPLGTGTAQPLTPAAPPRDLGPPVVGTYVIETPDLRLELKDTVPLGSFGSFDASVTVGASVTFAVDKNLAYTRDANGTEHRLRITKKIAKAKR